MLVEKTVASNAGGFRGVVIGSEWIRGDITISTADFLAGNPNPRQSYSYTPMPQFADPVIRRSLLYFDQIDWPTNDVVPPDFSRYALLEEQGLITHFEVRINQEAFERTRGGIGAVISGANVHAFMQREAENPGAWAFAPLAEDVPWWSPTAGASTELRLEDKRAIQFELINALPVPAEDVEFADILDYRARRRDELLAMRAYLNELYGEIMGSRDLPHTKLAILTKLDAAIADVASTMRESGMRGKWFSVGVDLVLDVPGGLRTGEWAENLMGSHTHYGAVIGVILGTYRFTKRYLKSPISRPGPLAYLVRAADEAVIELPVSPGVGGP
jgi:hypothetical protein